MPMMTAALISGGTALLGSVFQHRQQQAQQAAQQRQFEWNEFTRRMDVQIKNRQISKQNAMRWMKNRDIARAANVGRAEEEFWLRYNYDNEVGVFSRSSRQANDQLLGQLHGSNINVKSQTAKQLLRQSLEGAKEVLVNKRVGFGTAMISARRRQDAALSQRDFGYTEHITFMPGENIQAQGSMSSALMMGLAQGAMAGYGAHQQAAFQNAAIQHYGTPAATAGTTYSGFASTSVNGALA